MLAPRTFAIALSLLAHASIVALAAKSPQRGVPAQLVSHEAIEVSLYSAVAQDEPESAPAHNAAEPRALPAPLPLAQAKPTRALNLGSPSPSAPTSAVAVERAPSTAAPAAPRFDLGAITTHAVAASSNNAQGASSIGPAATESLARPLSESEVTTRARLLVGPAPSYTAAAAAAGIEAELPFDIVVDGSGGVRSARPLARAGYGLDEVAALAIRNYRFSPARRGQVPVAVSMRWLIRFQLR